MFGRARLSGPATPLIGAAVGLLVGLAVTLLVDSTYRADASIVLVRQDQPPGNDPQLAQAAEAAAERGRTARSSDPASASGASPAASEVAYPDGRLPGHVDLVIEDVFAPLIERARQGREHRSPTNPPGWSRGA